MWHKGNHLPPPPARVMPSLFLRQKTTGLPELHSSPLHCWTYCYMAWNIALDSLGCICLYAIPTSHAPLICAVDGQQEKQRQPWSLMYSLCSSIDLVTNPKHSIIPAAMKSMNFISARPTTHRYRKITLRIQCAEKKIMNVSEIYILQTNKAA